MPDVPRRRSPWWQHTGAVVAADGTPLAYARGGPSEVLTLVCCNGLGVSTFFWDHVAEYFTDRFQVVVWDYRGHGASGRPPHPNRLTIADLAEDLARVLDACGVADAVLLGHSLGCQVLFEFWNRHPQRVRALIPMLGSFGRPADTLLDPRFGRWIYRVIYQLGTKTPDLVQLVLQSTLRRPLTKRLVRLSGLIHPDLCPEDAIDPYLDHMAHQDMEVFAELLRAAQQHDAATYLDRVAVPTLVVAGERDVFTPRHLSVEMASRIADAELLEIPRGSHAALVEQPELINLRLEKFLQARVLPRTLGPGAPPEGPSGSGGKGPEAA